jgi:hypothetical protein
VISELLRISKRSPVRDALPSSLSSFKKIIQLQHAQIELLALRLGGRSRHTPFRTVPTRLLPIYNPPISFQQLVRWLLWSCFALGTCLLRCCDRCDLTRCDVVRLFWRGLA